MGFLSLRQPSQQLEEYMSQNSPKLGNPAVVGLAGFGLTTLMLQLHNIGLVPGIGPIVALGLIFGGLAQMIAGLQEYKNGNNFGYSAFTSYGAFWIALSLIFIGNRYKIFETTQTELGWFLVVWMLYSMIMFVGALRIHMAMTITFGLLVIGFALLVLSKFVDESFHVIAGYELILCALAAWYMMAGIILNELYGRVVLPMGKAPLAAK
jgi:uncharacterized protein